jgi:ABC-2 type transport system permease protein
MQFNRTMAIALRQYYLIRGSLTRIVPLFIWVAIDIVLWGFITRYLNNVTGSAGNFVPMMLGTVLLWDFLVRVMQGTTMAFMEDAWSRNFLNMFASPLRIPEYLSGLVISSIATSTVGLFVMVALAGGVFGLSYLTYGVMIAPFLLVLFLFGIALGIFGCAIMLRLGPAAEWFVWPIPAIISPFACVFYPLATLPHWMQCVSAVLPPAYVFEGMRKIVAGGAVSGQTLAIGAGLDVAYILLACAVFTRVYRYAVKTGLIARYSAESVS